MFLGIDVRKLLLNALVLLGALLVPAYLIYLSNGHVFPSTLAMANGMLWIVVIAGIACMLVASHEGADPRLRAVAIGGKILLGIVLWWNLGGHWQLAREVDGAAASVTEANVERERLNQLATDQAEREKQLLAARAEEARANAQLANAQRARLAVENERCRILRNCRPLPAPTVVPNEPPATAAATAINPATIRPTITPDQVRAKWTDSLTWRAYIEAGVAILILVLLGTLWHVDWDQDGFADRIRRLPASVMARLYPEAYARYYPQGSPGVSPPSPASAVAFAGAAPVAINPRSIGFAPPATVGAHSTGGSRPLAGTSAPTLGRGAAPTTAAPAARLGAATSAHNTIEIIGYRMPVIENIEYEGKNSKGVIVAGWIPAKRPGDRRAPRLGQFGKRRLDELFRMSAVDRRTAIETQIEEWKAEKAGSGII